MLNLTGHIPRKLNIALGTQKKLVIKLLTATFSFLIDALIKCYQKFKNLRIIEKKALRSKYRKNMNKI